MDATPCGHLPSKSRNHETDFSGILSCRPHSLLSLPDSWPFYRRCGRSLHQGFGSSYPGRFEVSALGEGRHMARGGVGRSAILSGPGSEDHASKHIPRPGLVCSMDPGGICQARKKVEADRQFCAADASSAPYPMIYMQKKARYVMIVALLWASSEITQFFNRISARACFAHLVRDLSSLTI
jgi:hypothetical protein